MDAAMKVLCAGEPLVVLVPDRRGSLAAVGGFTPYAAGAELNTAIGLARLGVPSALACAVGDDPFGERIVRAARAEGVDTSCVARVEGYPTAVFFKQWAGLDGATSVYYYRSTSPMAQGRWELAPILQALKQGTWTWLHTTGITGMLGPEAAAGLTSLLTAARQGGCTVSFDINVRRKLADLAAWRALAAQVAPWVDWYFLGDEEAEALLGTSDPAAVAASLRACGFAGRGVIVKRGAAGAAACVGDEVLTVPAWPVAAVVDTVGAGDGFNAGFIAGMARGWPVAEALRLGTLVGAFAVTAEGDYEGYPLWREAKRHLQQEEGVLR